MIWKFLSLNIYFTWSLNSFCKTIEPLHCHLSRHDDKGTYTVESAGLMTRELSAHTHARRYTDSVYLVTQGSIMGVIYINGS